MEGIDLSRDPHHGINCRYEVYRLWARLLHYWRAKLPHHSRFDFDGILKCYLREFKGSKVVDYSPSPDAIRISKSLLTSSPTSGRLLVNNYVFKKDFSQGIGKVHLLP